MITKEWIKDYINFHKEKTKGRYMWKYGNAWYEVQTLNFSALPQNNYKGVFVLVHSEKPTTQAALEWTLENEKLSVERLY